MKKAAIIGAGPAGLSAAYELLRQSDEYEVYVFEKTNDIGGISKTVHYKGNCMDMGGHRFFSKIPEVNAWWQHMMPLQGRPAYDDSLLDRGGAWSEGGPDPEKEDAVMLKRRRISRIYFEQKFFDYPVSLSVQTIRNMGLKTTLGVGFSYLKACICKREEHSLEDFYINRFGSKMYHMFFEKYTENLWGRHPREISAEWGAQRVKGLSVIAILKNICAKKLRVRSSHIETSLIEEFLYPKYGPGQLWEMVAEHITQMGGTIIKNAEVIRLKKDVHDQITTIVYEEAQQVKEMDVQIVMSSMPLKDLVSIMNDVPKRCRDIARQLPYRDYMTVGVLLKNIDLKNQTSRKTVGDIVPDDWIYVHDQKVRMGRIQVYNNWSPYLVRDLEHTVWLGLEYFCEEGDALWSMTDAEFTKLAVNELQQIGFIHTLEQVLDSHVERVQKAYPAYFDSYEFLGELIEYLNEIQNMYCIGRNGQHHYNNMDHSMCTAFEAVKHILSNETDKMDIWKVNTEKVYHEKG